MATEQEREEYGRSLGLLTPAAAKEKFTQEQEMRKLRDAQERVVRARRTLARIQLEREALQLRQENAEGRLLRAERDVLELS